jgi:hypothetical protein
MFPAVTPPVFPNTSQPSVVPSAARPPAAQTIPSFELPSLPSHPNPPAPPAEKSIEQTLDELERVQAQKAELDKKELELKAAVRKKLEQQSERLNKLGVRKVVEPDRVSRIFIEGNTKTADQTILDILGVAPGQVLQQPWLEVARGRLEKAGFRNVVVEVVPGLAGTEFKDIRVKLVEPTAGP